MEPATYGQPDGLLIFAAGMLFLSVFTFIVWGIPALIHKSRRRTTTPAASVRSQPVTKQIVQVNKPPLMPLALWVEALNEAPHLLIYGPSKAGKSTIAQAYVATFPMCEYVVIDPMPNKPNENKWGGIDFITMDSDNEDDFASIKAALDAIIEEDTRRKRLMKNEVFAPLVVIIDEVLGLVDALGTVKNVEGKNESRMSAFIRQMGYAARHRNIKIVLIGQGKNLADLGLQSATARNNYALIRASRNAASNERVSYIVTGDGEIAMDTSSVPRLAVAAHEQSKLWMSMGSLPVCLDNNKIDSALESQQTADRPQTDRQTDATDSDKSAIVVSLIQAGKGRDEVRGILRRMGIGLDNNAYSEYAAMAKSVTN